METEPLISVIIPTYNIEKYIGSCLKSVCAQTYKWLEILVIDDGSTDHTASVIQQMADRDPRIVPVYKKHAGVSAARNEGVKRASGDYVGFVDGDDTIEKEMYESLLQNAIKYDADISHCGFQNSCYDRICNRNNTGELLILNRKQGLYEIVKEEKITGVLWNKLFMRKIITGYYFDENLQYGEDTLFVYTVFHNTKRSVFEDRSFYHYRARADSTVMSGSEVSRLKVMYWVFRKLMSQEADMELYQSLEKKYMCLLEDIVRKSKKELKYDRELLQYQKERRQELKKKLKSRNLKAEYSRIERFRLKTVLISPRIYRGIRFIYICVIGKRRREDNAYR